MSVCGARPTWLEPARATRPDARDRDLVRRHSSANPDPSIQVLVNWSDLRAPLDRAR